MSSWCYNRVIIYWGEIAIFNLELGIKEINHNDYRIISRTAVRAVILEEGKLLMVLTNRNDYKFPGGGIQPKENIEEALIREVEEETGYVVKNTKERLGVIVQRDIDKYEKDAIFEMTSYYYLCEVTGTKFEQRLDDYEEEQNFHPVWITIEAAIKNNEYIFKERKNDLNDWVYRELQALKEIKAMEKNLLRE